MTQAGSGNRGARLGGGVGSDSELLVADSFRVREDDGHAWVRGFALHLARFRASSLAAATEGSAPRGFAEDLDAFLTAIPGKIAAGGTGFPRLELWANAVGELRLELELRPLPPLSERIELRADAEPRTLAHPERKGPGIAHYAALRNELGAEPLLVDAHGFAIEGGTTSLLWWDGGEARVSAATARVASVTERLVSELLAATGVRVTAASATPAELATTEVWALNALHGIRRVTSIDGLPLPAAVPARLAQACVALDRSWEQAGLVVTPGVTRQKISSSDKPVTGK